ncbi:MAG: hypothetical protein SFU91_13050 [Chloroherpetonaceae bacterium]|nr:hypothetical protein [Chloroherpetonaceae bacterium]
MPKRENIHRRFAKSIWKLVEVQIFFWVSILSGGNAIMKHSLADASKAKDKTIKTASGKVYHRGIENFVFERPKEPDDELFASTSQNNVAKLPSSAIEKGADSHVSIAAVADVGSLVNLFCALSQARNDLHPSCSLEGYFSSDFLSDFSPMNLHEYLIPLRS